MQQFQAIRYSSGVKEGVPVKLSPQSSGLRISTDNGEGTTIDYADLELMPVGYTDKHANFKQISTGDSFISQEFRMLAAIVAVGRGDLCHQIERRLRTHKKETANLFSTWALFTAGLIAAGIGLMFLTDFVSAWAVEKTPIDIETSLGQGYIDNYRKEHKMLEDAPEAVRINKLGNVLVSKLGPGPYQFHFYTEDSKEVNAFAVPGGNIIVYSQLVKDAHSDDELVGILGHEMGHVLKRHSLRAAFHNAGTWFCFQMLFGSHSRHLGNLLNQFLKLDQLSYSRLQEQQADDAGVELCMKAGYDPNALIGFFQRLSKTMGAGDNKALELLVTHPMPSERAEHIRAEIERLKKTRHCALAQQQPFFQARAYPSTGTDLILTRPERFWL